MHGLTSHRTDDVRGLDRICTEFTERLTQRSARAFDEDCDRVASHFLGAAAIAESYPIL